MIFLFILSQKEAFNRKFYFNLLIWTDSLR